MPGSGHNTPSEIASEPKHVTRQSKCSSFFLFVIGRCRSSGRQAARVDFTARCYMKTGNSAAGIIWAFIFALLGAPLAVPKPAAAPPTHIYVVAVHDSSLFTFCPPELRTALASGEVRHLRKLPNDYVGPAFGFMRYQISIKADGRFLALSPKLRGRVQHKSNYFQNKRGPTPTPQSPRLLENSRQYPAESRTAVARNQHLVPIVRRTDGRLPVQ